LARERRYEEELQMKIWNGLLISCLAIVALCTMTACGADADSGEQPGEEAGQGHETVGSSKDAVTWGASDCKGGHNHHRRLPRCRHHKNCEAATPAGIVFDRGGDIYSALPDGTRLVQLTTSADGEIAPAWSPDRSQIAYLRLDRGDEQYSLWVMNRDGSNQHEILKGQVGRYLPRTPIVPGKILVSEYSRPNAVSWSPDGAWILYSHARPGLFVPPGEIDEGGTDESYAGELHLIAPDGTGDHDIAFTDSSGGARNEMNGRFSPDGVLISFNVDDGCPDCAGGAWTTIMNADGSSPRAFIERALDQSWSPDGSHLVYVTRDGLTTQLATALADGTDSHVVYSDTGETAIQWPRYAPDGSKLIYEANGQLYFINLDGTGRRLFLAGSHPDW
jgi:Tol biopolymer transport system component